MSALNALLLRGLVARASYRLGLHGKFAVSRYDIILPPGKHLTAPLSLAFASDLHAGATTDPRMFELLFDEIDRIKPDLVLLGGDYVCVQARDVQILARYLSKCRPPLGKYAVLGNHDLWSNDAHIVRQLMQAGVDVLVNRSCALPAPFDDVSICGIDDPWTGSVDIASTFSNAGPIRIFLSHSPDGLLLLRGESFDLGLAGHTHGGQVALPDGTPVVSAGGPLARSHSRGRFEMAGRGPMIVSRGVGCSNVPVRINADPELVVCTLQAHLT